MKKNTFYLLAGCIAVALLAAFWCSIELHIPFLITPVIIAGAIILYYCRTRVSDIIDDERSSRISEKAALRTLQVFWVVFCAFSVGAVLNLLTIPRFFHEHHENFTEGNITPPPVFPGELMSVHMLGYYQLGFLCLMIFLYVGFRMYYARKYGDWETDEE